ncbi:MAG: hypothetical protein NVSMB44_40620 [Ktedonobacteraceae bacterium]
MSQENSENAEAGTTRLQGRCRVIKDYQTSNVEPFSILVGESFQVSEKSNAWADNADWIWVWCRGKPRIRVKFYHKAICYIE